MSAETVIRVQSPPKTINTCLSNGAGDDDSSHLSVSMYQFLWSYFFIPGQKSEESAVVVFLYFSLKKKKITTYARFPLLLMRPRTDNCLSSDEFFVLFFLPDQTAVGRNGLIKIGARQFQKFLGVALKRNVTREGTIHATSFHCGLEHVRTKHFTSRRHHMLQYCFYIYHCQV